MWTFGDRAFALEERSEKHQQISWEEEKEEKRVLGGRAGQPWRFREVVFHFRCKLDSLTSAVKGGGGFVAQKKPVSWSF